MRREWSGVPPSEKLSGVRLTMPITLGTRSSRVRIGRPQASQRAIRGLKVGLDRATSAGATASPAGSSAGKGANREHTVIIRGPEA